MFGHGTQNLSYLVRLCLTPDVLQIEDVWYLGMAVNVVATTDPGEPESKRLHEPGEVAEVNIGELASVQLFQQSLWVHLAKVRHECDTCTCPSLRPREAIPWGVLGGVGGY